MRILISGFIVFAIWAIFSTWLFKNKIRPAMKDDQVAEQKAPKPTPASEASSVITPNSSNIPDDLLFYFDFDDARIKPNWQVDSSILGFKSWIEANGNRKILITGHTDYKGTYEYNQRLGMKRANSTMNYLSGKGISKDNIITFSKGESEPVADQATEEGRAKNRRSVVTIKN